MTPRLPLLWSSLRLQNPTGSWRACVTPTTLPWVSCIPFLTVESLGC